ANAGCHSEARRTIDAHRVRRAVRIEVRLRHRGESQRIDSRAGHRQADQSARLFDHEVDHCRRHQLRRADEIPFVLAILVVRDDDELAVADGVDCLFYRSETHVDSLSKRCTYFPNISASTCTCWPGTSVPNVV